ncbi:WD repeat-containing protein 43 [Trichinella pseudospiralis]|uniref:WD repeat-containing protein 43 n=1 Tax=Trichinella pseudospiralis TaxID=6337 RepID=A0A0V1IVM2_TRIPS|nr:WD repeat-containing protein 43 [Trichinella pseudospiralis]KRZ26785.1 WD repeat-containing protein 43 [Trichinella pseudospiralis]
MQLEMFEFRGHLLAGVGEEGIRVYNFEDNRIIQEHVPPDHLRAVCQCIAWKENRESSTLTDEDNLFAVGTSVGSILVLRAKFNDLVATLVSDKTGEDQTCSTNCLRWSSHSGLFSGFDDGKVIQFNVEKRTVVCQWKAHSSPVYSLEILPHQNEYLITASQAIKMWDLKTKQCVRKFAGHSSPVFALKFAFTHQVEDGNLRSYFISAAQDDRLISAWEVNSNAERVVKKPVVTMIVSVNPTCITVSEPFDDNETVYVNILTADGYLKIFDLHINGFINKPSKPRNSICVASESERGKILPILAANFSVDNHAVIFLYGSAVAPGFAKLKLLDLESEVCLIREDPIRSFKLTLAHQSTTNAKAPIIDKKKVKYFHANDDCQLPVKNGNAENKLVSEVTMEERLMQLVGSSTVDVETVEVKPSLKSQTLLLTQGLHSKDDKILKKVLKTKNTETIKATVRKLPVTSLVPLLEYIAQQLRIKPRCTSYLLWLEQLCSFQTTYLCSNPEALDVMDKVLRLLQSRTSSLEKVYSLQGRLDMIFNNLSEKSTNVTPFSENKPKLVFSAEDWNSSEKEDAEVVLMIIVNNFWISKISLLHFQTTWNASKQRKLNGISSETEAATNKVGTVDCNDCLFENELMNTDE